ncbi:MAG: glycosyltransferase family 39 protein [Chloroflexota bacterium]
MVKIRIIEPQTRLITTLLLLIVFGVALHKLDEQSLWFDEAWTAHAIDSPAPQTFEPPRGLRAQIITPARTALTDVQTTIERVRGDVHPPLYFLLLDAWVFAAGNSVFTLRYPSLLVMLIGVAALFKLARQLFTSTTGLYATLLYGTAMLTVYYSREARMYTLLMTLAIASTLTYTRLLRRPTSMRLLLYGLLAVLALYTHYTAALVLLSHGIHSLFTGRWRTHIVHMVVAFVLPVILFSAYLPTVWSQLADNPGGSLAVPIETSVAALVGLGLILTGGWWWLYAIVLVTAGLAWRINRSGMLLITLWLLVTPLVLLIANATVLPVYQVRYALGALPAVAVMLAVGLSTMHHASVGKWIAPVFAAAMVYAQFTSYGVMFPDKPAYQSAVATVVEQRSPLEPIITDMAPRDPTRYYSEQMALADGIALDLSWRDHTAAEIDTLVNGFASAEHMWLVMPVNVSKTWRTVAALQAQGREITHRASVHNMLFYRFSDTDEGVTPLELRFENSNENTIANYIAPLAATVSAGAGTEVCVPLQLDFENTENTGISLTIVRGFNHVVAQWNGTPDDTQACLSLADAAPGDYYVYMTLYDTVTEARLAVLEADVWWGWWIVSHHIVVEQDTAE